MKTPLLETERLILRPIAISDAPAIQKHFNNWNVIKNLSTVIPWPYPEDGAESYIKELCLPALESETSFIWTINLKSEPEEAIGVIDFRVSEDREDRRGFWIAEEYQNIGYMSEALAATQDFIFLKANINSFKAKNAKTNARSRRMKEKAGARFIGYCELPHHNGETETEIWEITRENWIKARQMTIE